MSASPLSGVRVLDLTRHLPGPLASHLMADLGARVIKIEEPSLGDPVRHALAGEGDGGIGALGSLLLSGVESVGLDLKDPESRDTVELLLARSDVLLASSRPGGLARLGLDPAELRERFPRLVVCAISGWGQEGPYAARAGHDLTYQAVAGALAPTAEMPAVPVADLVGAWSAVAAVLAALFERERTGRGSTVDAALFDAATHANLIGWAEEAAGPRAVGERLALTGGSPCYGLYRTADGGWLALAGLEPPFWQRFCRAAGRPDLIRAQYSRSPRARRRVEALIASHSREEWTELLRREDIPGEPVLSAAEAREHPQARERQVVTDGPDGSPRLGFPARFDGERPRAASRAPELGEHTAAVFAELGLDPPSPRGRRQRATGIVRRWGLKRALARLLGQSLRR